MCNTELCTWTSYATSLVASRDVKHYRGVTRSTRATSRARSLNIGLCTQTSQRAAAPTYHTSSMLSRQRTIQRAVAPTYRAVEPTYDGAINAQRTSTPTYQPACCHANVPASVLSRQRTSPRAVPNVPASVLSRTYQPVCCHANVYWSGVIIEHRAIEPTYYHGAAATCYRLNVLAGALSRQRYIQPACYRAYKQLNGANAH